MQWTCVYTRLHKVCDPAEATNELSKIAEKQREKHGSGYVRRKPMAVEVHTSRDEMVRYRYRPGEIVRGKFVWM